MRAKISHKRRLTPADWGEDYIIRGLRRASAKNIEQISDLAGVPAARRALLKADILLLVSNTLWNWAGGDESSEQSPDSELLPDKRARSIAGKRVRKARSILIEAAVELQSAIADYDSAHGDSERCRAITPKLIDKLLADLLAWDSKTENLFCGPSPLVARRRGRPLTGPVGDAKTGMIYDNRGDQFFNFIMCLISTIEEFGGELTFDKNYPVRGTLVEVLELLRPHLFGFMPPVLPVGKIVSARRLFSQGFGPLFRNGGAWSQTFPVLEGPLKTGKKNRRSAQN
jgi:hypothetical protein